MNKRYDLTWHSNPLYADCIPKIELHWCRAVYSGTTPVYCDETHGYTFEEAKKEVIQYLTEYITRIENTTEEQFLTNYMGDD